MENIYFKKLRSFVLPFIFVSVGYPLFAGTDKAAKVSPFTVADTKKNTPVIVAANKPGTPSVKTSEKNIDKIFEETMALIELDEQDKENSQNAKLRTLKEKLLEAKIKELEKRHPAPDGIAKTAWKTTTDSIYNAGKFMAGDILRLALTAGFSGVFAFALIYKVTGISPKTIFGWFGVSGSESKAEPNKFFEEIKKDIKDNQMGTQRGFEYLDGKINGINEKINGKNGSTPGPKVTPTDPKVTPTPGPKVTPTDPKVTPQPSSNPGNQPGSTPNFFEKKDDSKPAGMTPKDWGCAMLGPLAKKFGPCKKS